MILRQFLHSDPVAASDVPGFERRHNRAFAIERADGFVRFMLAEIPPSPPQAAAVRAADAVRAAA